MIGLSDECWINCFLLLCVTNSEVLPSIIMSRSLILVDLYHLCQSPTVCWLLEGELRGGRGLNRAKYSKAQHWHRVEEWSLAGRHGRGVHC